MKNILLAVTITGSWICWVSPAGAEITMRLSDMCGFQANDWEVEIWNPPGGYVRDISPDGTFTADVEEGHKLSAVTTFPPEYFEQRGKARPFGPWSPAKAGGELRVECDM